MDHVRKEGKDERAKENEVKKTKSKGRQVDPRDPSGKIFRMLEEP